MIKKLDYRKEEEKTVVFCKKIGNRIEDSTKKAVEKLFNYNKEGIKND